MSRLLKIVISLLFAGLLWGQTKDGGQPSPANDAAGAPANPSSPADSVSLQAISKQKPVYPKEALDGRIQGQVALTLTINEAGDVDQAEVVSGDPILAKAAVEAAKNWKYQPFIKNGHATKIQSQVSINFVLPTQATVQPGDSTVLEPVKVEAAVYPLPAINQQIQGRVWIKLLISETGDVEHVDVISGEPLLAMSAVDAAKKWKFKPFIRDGKPVKVGGKVPLDFAFADKVMEKGVSGDGSTTSDGKNAKPAVSYPTIPVQGEPVNPSASPAAGLPQRVRVSQGVTQGLLVYQVAPVYPMAARYNHVQGTVLLRATIGKDGNIRDLQVISGPEELTRAAIDAVEQWRYRPYLLMGQPVEVDTQIQVNFRLSR
jgi:TonB family protein